MYLFVLKGQDTQPMSLRNVYFTLAKLTKAIAAHFLFFFTVCVRPCIKTNPFVENLMQLKIQINFYDEQDSFLGLSLSSEIKTTNKISPSN